VVIVSEAMARRFWTDGDAVGWLVRRRGPDPSWLVVGVASDAKVTQLGESPRKMIYLPASSTTTSRPFAVSCAKPARTIRGLRLSGASSEACRSR